jgi:hypothetical protein
MITKQNIIDQLNEFYLKYKKIPSRRQYELFKNTDRHNSINKFFGSWNNCLLEIFGKINTNSAISSTLHNCKQCNKSFLRFHSYTKKSKTGNQFCNKSCAASFNNKLKRKSRRSKIEEKFYNLLVKEFPNLNILPNDKTMLNGLETDIAVPSLNLAIEWNGSVHFKPIYGVKKLKRIKELDQEKLKIANNKNINLIVITDLVSNDATLQKAFDDVKKIIKSLI